MPSKRYLTETEQETIRDLFHSEHGVDTISKMTKISYKVIDRYWREWFTTEEFKDRCSRLNRINKIGSKNPMHGKKGMLHHRAKERTVTTQGYYEVFPPEWYTGNTNGGKVLEHILVYCEHNGLTEIPKGHVVHHIDHSRDNNSPDNLQMMTIGEHLRHHNTTHGKYVKVEGATTIPRGSRVQGDSKRNPSH